MVSDFEDLVHPEDYFYESENFWHYPHNEQYERKQNIFSCDGCERSFFSEVDYDKHMSEHRVCNLEGCSFAAHEKIIEKHIRMQHSTGLYDKIKNIETPEDIKKWLEDRKRKYPNKSNIQKRYVEQEEKLRRGERINKSGKKIEKYKLKKVSNTKRELQNYNQTRRKCHPKQKMQKSLINEKSDWNQAICPFKGTSELYKEEPKEETSKYEDDEWSTTFSNTVITLNNSLGALMGAYMSDDEFEDVVPQTNKAQDILQKDVDISITNDDHKVQIIEEKDDDNDPPVECTIERKPLINCVVRRKNRHNQKQSSKRKRITNRNKYNSNRNKFVTNNKQGDKFPYNSFKKRKVTLLEKLLYSEIIHERNVLLQCVRYAVSNNFFETKI